VKVSIIVPVYNAGKTLIERVGNLLNQTLSDIEIIFINDASTDNTLAILESAKNQFPDRVRVLSLKENKGPGAARNAGLSVATGDYIGFCDSDDIVDSTMYEKLYNKAMENNADIVDCAFYRESQSKAFRHFTNDIVGEISAKQKSIILQGGFCVTKIFKRSLIYNDQNEPTLFREEYGLEDMDYLMGLIARAKIFHYVEDILYIYKDSDNSLSKEQDFFKYYRNHASAMLGIYDTLSSLPNYSDFQDAAEICMATMYINIKEALEKMHGKINDTVLQEMENGIESMKKQCIQKPISKNPYFTSGLSENGRTLILKEEG
jgi:glycosyltransferase involved in cell wall biosynthesis